MKIAILGAGNVGKSLYRLFKEQGVDVSLCSRMHGNETTSFEEGISRAGIVFLAIPYTACEEVLSSLRHRLLGKIVVDCTNPLQEDWSPLMLGQANSAAEEIARLIPDAKVVKAFNTIFADVMNKEKQDRKGQKITAFIAGDDRLSKLDIMSLAEKIGFTAVDVGALKNSRYLEAMAHLNIQIALNQGAGTNVAFIYSIEK